MNTRNGEAFLLLGFFYAAFALRPPESVSFSPKTWFAKDFQRLEALSLLNSQRRPKPLAFSDGKGMVAGTSSALAVHAGKEALRKGGNAMDACLTTALTEITLAAGSRVSYAGTANILYYDSSTGETYNIDGGWNKPYYVDPAQIPEHHSDQSNGASVLIPGFIAAVSTASKNYGLLPLSKLLEPALYFAARGFTLPAHLAKEIRMNYNPSNLLRTKEGKYIFTNPKTNNLYKAGERFRQPKLAKFLKRLSKHGKDYFYRGLWAEDMVEIVQSQKGYVTMEDMSEYNVRTPEPASTLYQRYHVLTSGAKWGGSELVEKLNLMELAGIGSSTQSYLTNATKLFWLASIGRLSSFISFFTHAVPNGKHLLKEHLGVEVDDSYRRTKESAEEMWDKIGSIENMKDINELMREMVASIEMDMESYQHGSSGVVSVDRGGNVCSLVHGTDSALWGSGLFVQGVSLPSPGITLKSFLKGTSSGGRVPSGLQPLIVFKEEFPEFSQFGRRLRRHAPMTKKRIKKYQSESQKHREHAGVKGPGGLVVFWTPKRVQSHMVKPPFARSILREHSTDPKRLERLVNQTKLEENGEDVEQEENIYFHKRHSLEEKRKERKNEASIPVHRKSPIRTTMGLEEMLPTNRQTQTQPLKPVPRKHPTENEKPYVSMNPPNAVEGEEMKNGVEDEETSETGNRDGKEKENEDLAKEEESREFPHLGLPDDWHTDIIEERGEPAFHTGLVPVLALTCAGPSHQFLIPQYLTNILDSGMNPKAALEAPTLLGPSGRSFQQDIQIEKYVIDDNILKEVGEFGQPFTEVDSQTAQDVGGTGAAVALNNGWQMLGCVHPFKEGLAEGVAVLEG